MKVESIPFYVVGLALVICTTWWFDTHEGHSFDEPEAKQYCRPQVVEGSFRWGRDAAYLEPSAIETGTLVLYRTPRSREEVTSRVVATQGQRVKIEAGRVYVEGKKLKDDYAHRVTKTDFFPELIVPAGCVFVLNDQRGRGGGDRRDSRAYGPISTQAISLVFSPKERQEGRRR